MSQTNTLTVLDCTLRDGGYYTNWDFSPTLVSRYLCAAHQAGIDYVEIGLRNFAKEGFHGPFAYSTEDYLATLAIPQGLKLGVMVDAKNLLAVPEGPVDAVKALFLPACESQVCLVRVAAHFNEIAACGPIINTLKTLGYEVGVNLMQAGGKAAALIIERVSALLAQAEPDVLYFADSLGNMDAAEVARLYNAFRTCWQGPMGIHTHNNRGLAIANSLRARELGVTWLDATVQGMGRGAGNAEMELLLTELAAAEPRYHAEALYPLAMEEFDALKRQHRWGPSLLYYFAAKHNIHPSYVQELLAEDRYTTQEIIALFQHLAELESSHFDKALFASAMRQQYAQSKGSWDASNWCGNRAVLLIAAGPTSKQYARDIVTFARRKNAIVLTVNTLAHIDSDVIDGVVSVDHNRIRFEAQAFAKLTQPIYVPVASLPEDCSAELAKQTLRDFGLFIGSGTLAISAHGCTLPHPLSAIYGIALALQGGAAHIYLAGFDGYEAGDSRQTEMLESLELLRDHCDIEQRITAVTPTTYPLSQGSLYAP